MDPHPVTLEGRSVRLEPLEERHADDLFAAGNDDAIWRYMPCDVPASVAAVRAMIRGTHAELERGSQVPFAIV
jgi:RimJ/RimL family protein N-acetyltransferase